MRCHRVNGGKFVIWSSPKTLSSGRGKLCDHFILRMWERFGVNLTDQDHDAILDAIHGVRHAGNQHIRVEFVERQSFDRSVWRMKFGDTRGIVVIYDSYWRCLVTALYEKMSV